ncbi:unnamed protein product [Adineta steineri]|uniref:NAD(P)(+)--arginine ADP-ribosyltransferase n=1 Tax=Adineta steineri TaxID=433720 RepID=A0A813V201_9BILA|nr:unnamed protein product [Adineta steineri]CAF0871363.1 unnamed protein product [Adineta steineri]
MVPNKSVLDKIEGYDKTQLVSLDKAIEPLASLMPDIKERVQIAKENSIAPADDLSSDESASICLYSQEWKPSERCLYYKLNAALREQIRENIQPWLSFLRLLVKAVNHLPSKHEYVYRGVKQDLHNDYPAGKKFIWWGFTSCTTTIDVLQPEKFLGMTGPRTLFTIECFNGKDISKHSCFTSENEILLVAGTEFEVIACLDNGGDYHTIQLKEIPSISPRPPPPPLPLPKPPSLPLPTPPSTPRSGDTQKLIDLILKFKPRTDVYLFGRTLVEKDMDIIVQYAIIERQCTGLYLKETNLTSKCLTVLAKALYNNTTLNGLYLSNNHTGDEGIKSLATALCMNNNRTLQCLTLGRNSISNEGAQYLAEMLKRNRTLKELWLSDNPIGDQGVQALTEALIHNNQTLEILSIGWDKSICDSSVDALVDMLMKNRSLKKVDLVSCKLSRMDKTRLREAVKSKKTIELQI